MNRDEITGLYNRRYFNELLFNEFKRYERYKTPFSIVVLEIKEKDRESFDQKLTFWGNLLRRFSRESDILARFGVHKFAVLLPDTTSNDVETWEQRILSHMTDEEATVQRISIPDECNTYDEFWTLYRIKILGERSSPLKYIFYSPPFTGYEGHLNIIKKNFPLKIHGPFGVGKTTLVKIANNNRNILEISCNPVLSEVPLYTLRNLLETVFNYYPEIVHKVQTNLNKEGADLINNLVQGLDIKMIGEEGAVYNILHHSLSKIFTHKEILNDVLIVVKGAQWLDNPTQEILRNLFVEEPKLPFIFIWDEEKEISSENYLVKWGFVHGIKGLSDKDEKDFLTKISENKVSLLPQEEGVISGNPFFLKEAVFNKIYISSEKITFKEEIFLQRFNKLDKRSREVLYLLAMTDAHETVTKLQHCLNCQEARLWDKLDNLLAYGLIKFVQGGHVNFVHRVIPYIVNQKLAGVKKKLICDKLGKVLKEEMSYPKEFYTFYLCNGLDNELNGVACMDFASILQKFEHYSQSIYYLNKALKSVPGTSEKTRIRVQIGKHFIKMGDFRKAEEVLEETAIISPESQKWEILCTIGELHLLRGNLEKAHELFRKAELCLKSGALKPAVDLDLARVLIEKHKYKRAKSILERVVRKISLKYPEILAEAYGYLSLISVLLGDIDDADYYLKEMNIYCEKAGHKICNSDILERITDSLLEQGKLSMCEAMHQNLIKLTEQYGSISSLATKVLSYMDFLLNIGDIGRFEVGVKKYNKLFNLSDSPRIRCAYDVIKARYLGYKGDYSEAYRLLKSSESYAERYEFYDLLAKIYSILGELGLIEKDLQLTNDSIAKGLKIIKKIKYPAMSSLLHYYKAILEREKNDLITAMEFAKIAQKEAVQSDTNHLLPLIYAEIAIISIMSGRRKRAINYINKANSNINPYKETIYYLHYLIKNVDFCQKMGDLTKAGNFKKLLIDLAKKRGILGLIK